MKGWKNFYIPLSNEEITLREAYEKMKEVRSSQSEVPLIIQLVENPKYDNFITRFFFDPFPGKVSLLYHDYIHLILGRWMLMKDEAFVIGFTMGSNDNMFTWRLMLYSFVARFLYRKPWKFDKQDVRIFWDAANTWRVSDTKSLSKANLNEYLDLPLKEIRKILGIEEDLLKAVYKVHAKRYPDDIASQRTIN